MPPMDPADNASPTNSVSITLVLIPKMEMVEMETAKTAGTETETAKTAGMETETAKTAGMETETAKIRIPVLPVAL